MTLPSKNATFLALAATLLLPPMLTIHAAKADPRPDYLAMNGAQLYGRFCASCHGASGRGDGPVAKSFAVEVPDLTLIARRHNGVFPKEQVEKIIDGRYIIGAHGTREMPVWGEEFLHTELGNPDAERVSERIVQKLMNHVESLQRPSERASKHN